MIGAAYAEEAGHGGGHGDGGGLPDPMHQFEIKRIVPFEVFGFDASFTNSAVWRVWPGHSLMRARAITARRS